MDRIETLEFGIKTAATASITVALGISSGIVLAFNFLDKQKNDSRNRNSEKFVGAVLFGSISLMVVFIKLLIGAFGPGILPFSLLRPIFNEMYEWTIHSQVPSFWVGLIIVWFMK